MPREPLRLVWKRPARSERREEPPPINDPPPPAILRRLPPPPPPFQLRPVPPGPPRPPRPCSGNCSPQLRHARVKIQKQHSGHDPWHGLPQGIQEAVVERLPLSSLMTVRAVSRAWNATLSAYRPRVTATLLVLHTRSSSSSRRLLVAFDTRQGQWAALPEYSLPCESSRLVGAAGRWVCAATDCPGRLAVGRLLTATWDEVALPSAWHSNSRGLRHTLASPSDSSYQIVSVREAGTDWKGNVVAYDSQQPGQWSAWEDMPRYNERHSVGFTVGGDTLYRIVSSELQLVSYSLRDQSTVVIRSAWPVDVPSLVGTMFYCAGQLFLMDLICPDRQFFGYLVEPPYSVAVWRFVAESSEWVVETVCPVMTRASRNGFCWDGDDTLWAVLLSEEDRVEKLASYSISVKEWALHPAGCGFRVNAYVPCLFLEIPAGSDV